MKKLFLSTLFAVALTAGFAQKVALTVNFSFANVVEGYDHDCKTSVFIDGAWVGESAMAKETKGGKIVVQVPTGEHTLTVMNYAYYEGKWQEHTVANEYSMDASFEESHVFKKAAKLFLLFDIDNGTQVSWKKKPAKQKKKK